EARRALPPRGLPGLRRVRAGCGTGRLRARLARRRPDALAGPLRLHDACARGDGADRGRQRRHQPAHPPPGGDGERPRDPGRPAPVRWAIAHVRAGAEEAGRDPDEVEIAALCAMHVSDDQEDAWEQCRWAPAACANHISYALKWNPQHGMPEEMTRLVAARDE